MAENKKSLVKVHSKLTVVSSRPTGPGKTHPLSKLDHAMALHTIHIVFYYPTNPFLEADLATLRVSLSELLCSYPPVTGRLTRRPAKDGQSGGGGGNNSSSCCWMVKCNDAGVRMLRAKVGTTLDEWLRFASGSDERDLTVWEDMPDDPSIWSPFCIQINDFEGGGLAIGLSCSHMHADQTSATLLVKSWTELQRGEPISQPPVFRRPTPDSTPSPENHTMLSQFYANKSKARASSRKMESATFRFSDSKMKQCLSKIRVKCPNATPFDALLALFWTRVVKLNPRVEQNHTHNLSVCIDSRKLIHPPLPIGYFGNALHFSRLSLDSEKLASFGLEHAVEIVHNHLARIKEAESCSVLDCFEWEKGEEVEAYEQPFMMYGPELTCISLEHMIIPGGPKGSTASESLIYEAMFRKDEKPVHVSYHVGNVEGEGLITIMPSLEGGLGRTVTVTLPEDQIAKLRDDQALLDMYPTMLMNGGR
ncbi:hypothetical protein Vadar_009063 [Vaccinium darrowii]|uniref:Uncharacterized protein n=1 Tax=Vaccinium darrowii TaxID=229202 RepID=A0ACB7XZB5_9ERIC|nr:hypothetical protein Vadar_009063 [Vaccinium darrowii]